MSIKFSVEEKRKLLPLVQRYFARERDEEMGILAAEIFLDFVAAEIGPFIYNKALTEARRVFSDTNAELEFKLYELEMPAPK